LQRADIKQFNHDFAGALVDLAKFTAERPENVQALLRLATIRQIQGNYSGALDECQKIAGVQLVIGKICSSGVRAMIGQAEAALIELKAFESLVLLRNQALLPYFFQSQADALSRLHRALGGSAKKDQGSWLWRNGSGDLCKAGSGEEPC
jgi:hypothetical protein